MYKAASLIFNEYGQIAAFYLLTSKKNTELNGYLLKFLSSTNDTARGNLTK